MATGYYYVAPSFYELQIARTDLPGEATPGLIVDVPSDDKIISKTKIKNPNTNLISRAPTGPRRMLLTRLE